MQLKVHATLTKVSSFAFKEIDFKVVTIDKEPQPTVENTSPT